MNLQWKLEDAKTVAVLRLMDFAFDVGVQSSLLQVTLL